MVIIQNSVMAVISLASVVFLMGCNPKPEIANTQQTAVEQLAELDRGIRNLISSPIAQDITSCKIVMLNTNSCQQPPKYLLYSTENTNEQVLLTLVAKYNQVVAAQVDSTDKNNQSDNNNESCFVTEKPSVLLEKDLCIPVQFATE